MAKVLRIRDWDKVYENNRTREMRRMDWVPMPNKMDGLGYAQLLNHPEGAAHFGAWVAIVEIASRCETRGTLMRGGVALTPETLSIISRIPSEIFRVALDRLVNEVGWIEEAPQEGAEKPQDPAEHTTPTPQEGAPRARAQNGTERKRTERNGTEADGAPPPPDGECSAKDLEYRIDSVRQLLYDFMGKIPDDGIVLSVESALQGATLDEFRDYLLTENPNRFREKSWPYLRSAINGRFSSLGRHRVITANEAKAAVENKMRV